VVSARGNQKLITVSGSQSVAEAVALMKKYDIEQIPIMNNGSGPTGAISEGGLFQKYLITLKLKMQQYKK
jgi:cystathionine beta-synthase